MSATISPKGLLSRSTKVVFDLMHGSLVMAGLILTLALAALLAGSPASADGLRQLRQKFVDAALPQGLTLAPPADDPSPPPPPRLAAEMRAALDHVAKRYRVSATALEPVFAAAQTTGRQLNVDPLLIIAIIGIESGFNPLAESVMGAQGLMQVMPRFHKDKLPADDDGLSLFDPTINVSVGARILKESIRRMGGLNTGLQQFGGALDDPDQLYSNKVLAERQRLEAASRRGRNSTTG